MRLASGYATNRGLVRQSNEDSFLVRKGLYVVCDGMGGARGGEVASQMACERMAHMDPATAGKDDLRDAIVDANRSIASRSAAEPSLLGMGTTMTAALVREGAMVIGHVGDSRAYLLHEGALRQVTDDHSWVGEMVRRGELTPAEAVIHPHRSVITKALGTEGETEPDILDLAAEPGDRLMLCSDGLSGMVFDAAMEELLRQSVGDPQAAADALVAAALKGGGEDNVTVVVVDVLPDPPGDEAEGADAGAGQADEGRTATGPSDDEVVMGPTDRGEERSSVPGFMRPALGMGAKLGRRPPIWARQAPEAAPAAVAPKAPGRLRRKWIISVAVIVIVLAVAVAGFAVVNSHIYYVGTSEGNVALYKGLPTTLIGIDLSSVVEVGSVQYASLPQYQQERVDAHDLVGKEEGQAFLRGLATLQ